MNRRAFSLVEVLLAMFILAIGLIMVATIFPVGAEWTRQASEDGVAGNVAQIALTVIRNNYAPDSANPNTKGKIAALVVSPPPGTIAPLQGIPNLTSIPAVERMYQFGAANAFPASRPGVVTYFWTAMIKPRESVISIGPGRLFDLYIFVFKKGSAEHAFYSDGSSYSDGIPIGYGAHNPPGGFTDLGTASNPVRDGDDSKFQPNGTSTLPYFHFSHFNQPTLVQGSYDDGTTYVPSSNSFVTTPYPPIGAIGVGVNSGTVFRQNIDVVVGKAVARPGIIAGEPIIYAPPADGTATSPLVYVYQTTVEF